VHVRWSILRLDVNEHIADAGHRFERVAHTTNQLGVIMRFEKHR
jgi:hypothetical protein